MKCVRLVLLVSLLMAVLTLFQWNRTGDPRFYQFVSTPLGTVLADLFGWWSGPLERPLADRPDFILTAQQRAIKQRLALKHAGVSFRDVYLVQRFPALAFEKTDGYSLLTDAQPEDQAHIVETLQRFRHEFTEVFGPLLDSSAGRVEASLIYLRDPAQFARALRQYAPDRKNVSGLYSPWSNILLVGELCREAESGLSDDARQTLRHEAAHQLFYSCGIHSRHRAEPDWLVEGLASYCETEPMGALNHARIELLLESPYEPARLAFDRLVGRRHDGGLPAHDLSAEAELFYSRSWSLVHLLMQPEHRASFFDFIRLVRDPARQPDLQAPDPAQRLARQLGLAPDDLAHRWQAHQERLRGAAQPR
jgi:hypothetical protein